MSEPESTFGIKKPLRGRSTKAGLIMPVSKVDRRIKAVSRRSSGTAAVYLAAVLENIVGELFQAAVNQTDRGKHRRVTVEDVAVGVKADPELHRMVNGLSVFSGDVLRHIPKAVRLSVTQPPPTAV